MNGEEWSAEQWEKCLRLKRQGLRIPDIARQLGVSPSALHGKLWRKGYSAKPGAQQLETPPDARPRRIRPGRSTLPPLASLGSSDAGS